MRRWGLAFLCACALLALAPLTRADDGDTAKTGWGFELQPYAWVPLGVSGDASVGERTTDVDVSAGDIFDDLQFAAAVRFEARRGRWGLVLDTMYVQLGKSRDGALGDVDLTSRSFIGDALASARAVSSDAIALDILAGGRIVWLDQELEIGPESADRSNTFPKFLLGLQALARLSQDWGLLFRGVVNAPDPGWSAFGVVQFKVSRVAIRAGYQYERINYDRNLLDLSVHVHGPYIGVGIQFGDRSSL